MNFYTNKITPIVFLGFAMVLHGFSDDAARSARLKKLNSRPRTVIWNSDGCDIFLITKNPTVEAFNRVRNIGLLGKNIEVLSYCTVTSGLGMTTATTKEGEDMSDHPKIGSVVKKFQSMKSDVLKESIKFAHANGMEGFWSLRINDCHDAFKECKDLFPKKKKARPDLLVGSAGEKPPYGYWSAYDFSKKEVRDWVCRMIVEVMENYEVDGIELDFCRHWGIFKSAAYGRTPSQAELDGISKMMKTLRSAADRIGMKRNRPILIAIRVMDSVEACRAMGLDLKRWFDERLVDLVAGGSEIRLNHPDYMGKLAKQYPDIKFYMTVTDAQISGQHPLLKRNHSKLNFRSQAAAAYAGGLHGIYSFNEYYPTQPYASYLKEIGDKKNLSKLNKCYYFSHSYLLADRFGKNWGSFQKMPTLSPASTIPLSVHWQELELYMGKEAPGGTYQLFFDVRAAAPETVEAQFNGVDLGKGKRLDTLTCFDIPEKLVTRGMNKVRFRGSASDKAQLLFSGKELLVYGGNQGSWRRLYGSEGFVPGKSEKIVDGAYLLRDVSNQYITNLAMPLDANTQDKVELSFEAKLVDSDCPDAVVVRVANSQYTETLQFKKDGVAFKHAASHAGFETGKFHSYKLVMEKNTLTLFADGQKLLSCQMAIPFDADDSTVMQYSKEKYSWLNRNSLIVGSLSPKGKGGGLFRNMQLRNFANAGRIFDGAVMVIHDAKANDLPPYFTKPLLKSMPKEAPSEVFTLDGKNYKNWQVLSRNAEKFKISGNKLLLNSRKIGPMLRHNLPASPAMLEIDFTYQARDLKTDLAQLQAVVTLDDPHDRKKSLCWAYRLGRKNINYFDDTPRPIGFTGKIRVKILIKPDSKNSDIYINGDTVPLLRNTALTIAKGKRSLMFGDGSVAVAGECELSKVTVKVYGGKSTLDELPAKAQSTFVLNAQNYKTWQRLSTNATNLTVKGNSICFDSRKMGPVLKKELSSSPKNFLEVDFSCKATDLAAKKAQMQFVVIVDGAKRKSNLFCYRFGNGYVRFGDEAPVKLKANPDGFVKAKVLVNVTEGVSELYVNDAKKALLINSPIAVKAFPASVSFGDGSVGVEGQSELCDVTIKQY